LYTNKQTSPARVVSSTETIPKVKLLYDYISSTGRRYYKGADKSLAQPGRKQATAREEFDFHISYL